MIADPPFDDGAANATVSLASPPTTEVIVGVPGTSAGTTGDDALEAGPTEPFVALTVNVYETPFVNPVTAHVSDEGEQSTEPVDRAGYDATK